jgi:acetyltransferase EpsM
MEWTRPVAVVGGGGLGREIQDYLADAGRTFAGFLDDDASVANRAGALSDAEGLDADLLLAVGSAEVRQLLIARLGSTVSYTTLLHPKAVVSPSATIGMGVVLHDHSIMNIHCMIGHDGVLGEASVVSPHVVLAGGSNVGPHCFVGSASVIFQGVTVGERSIVSAGSMVNKNVPAGSFVAGNPARVIPRSESK